MPREMTPARVMKLEKDFPTKTPHDAALKLSAIGEAFGVSQTRYYQVLNVLIDDPAFIQIDPVFARVLRARRENTVRRNAQRLRQSA